MVSRGLNILDETSEATKAKTGATGDHFHIEKSLNVTGSAHVQASTERFWRGQTGDNASAYSSDTSTVWERTGQEKPMYSGSYRTVTTGARSTPNATSSATPNQVATSISQGTSVSQTQTASIDGVTIPQVVRSSGGSQVNTLSPQQSVSQTQTASIERTVATNSSSRNQTPQGVTIANAPVGNQVAQISISPNLPGEQTPQGSSIASSPQQGASVYQPSRTTASPGVSASEDYVPEIEPITTGYDYGLPQETGTNTIDYDDRSAFNAF
jgi:hypothetical protein